MGLFKKLFSVSPRYWVKEAARRYRIRFRPEWNDSGKALQPYAVSFWITRRCNLRCSMCFVDNDKEDPSQELSLTELKHVLDDVAKWHPRIGITGGEPLIRRDLIDFIHYAKQLGLKVGLNSNAVMIDRDYAEALVSSGLDNLTVSIDGPTEIHDRIRGKSGLFEKSMKGLKFLKEAKAFHSRIRPLTRITCTITKDNQNALGELAAIASNPELGLEDLGIQHLWFIPPLVRERHSKVFEECLGQDSHNLDGFVSLDTGIVVEEVIRSLAELKSQCSIPIVFNPNLSEQQMHKYYKEESPVLAPPCYSRFLRIEINPYGEVTPCLSYSAGNVRDDSVPNIWNNQRYRRFRSQLVAKKYFPGCLRCCGLFSD